ncbi:Stress activated transcription factor atfs-1 [Caenorhabditis elegans]|uniref:Isoform c of Stress activated transcription factor atfs-1 n=1 Tax=Caenorhabditis elegans TaxID=6239 RepID=Q23272-3|nr:Stress activated transcription factor atfs-1 [Caenorhabditis elegans]CAI91180.1 Stress activated transcription factor atfs-1 [Caenorhabditis elegans]|eukprot:NP_001024302.1 Stress activated transcription factor atfs-1 [Caenorhabditis elegans]
MFSRVGRLTTFGAQAVSNCPFRRDNIYQQPLKVTAPINDQLTSFAHSFSDSVRHRTTSFGNDPFLGVPMDDDEVIKELELLDLDSWHTKPRAPCPAPSDELELDQFWEGKNVTLEAWRPTDSWQNGSSVGHPHGHQQQQQTCQQPPTHSSTTETMHDFSNFGDNMGSPLFQSPSKSAIDQLTGTSRIDEFQYGMPPQDRKLSKFEMDIEQESKAVDWEAWNHYLESDDDVFKRPEAFFKEEPMIMTSSDSLMTSSTSSPDSGISLYDPMIPPPSSHFPSFNLSSSSSASNLLRLSTPSAPMQQEHRAPVRMHHDVDLFSSGPLLCVPKQEDVFDDFIQQRDDDDEDYIPASEARRTSSRLNRKSATPTYLRRRDSERSWTPASDDYFPEEHQKFKKRGVVLKPSVDEETDRRRMLNRIAAVRYREKKRAEKKGRKMEFQEVADRNRILLQKERQLKREINSMKKELRKMGAIIQ